MQEWRYDFPPGLGQPPMFGWGGGQTQWDLWQAERAPQPNIKPMERLAARPQTSELPWFSRASA
jgi:hypothetical protein